MEQPTPKRKHRATGNPAGGARPGAGRPKGSKNALGYGEAKAIKVARLRVPDNASPEAADLADRALQRIVDVMDEKVGSFSMFGVLNAATRVREEICGPIAKKVEHSGSVTLEQLILAAKQDDDEGDDGE